MDFYGDRIAYATNTHLRHHDKLVARKVELLDSVPQDDFREPVGVDLTRKKTLLESRRRYSRETTHVRGIKRRDPVVPAESTRV